MHYVEDGLVIHDAGGPVAMFKLNLHRQELLTADQVEDHVVREVQRLSAFAGSDAQLLGVPHAVPVEEWVARHHAVERQRGVAGANPGGNLGFEQHLAEQVQRVMESEDLRKQVYLLLWLVPVKEAEWGGLRGLLRKADRWLDVTDPRPSKQALAEYREQVEALRRRVSTVGGLGGDIASAAEIRWVLKRTFWRGLDRAIPPEPRRPAWGGEIQALFEDAVTRNHHSYLQVQRPLSSGEFYVATICFARFPDELPALGGQWLSALEELHNAPMEWSVRFRVLSHPESRKAVDRLVEKTIDQTRNIEESGSTVPPALEQQALAARSLQMQVVQGREPVLVCNPRVMVTAPDVHELRRRTKAVIEHMKDELAIEGVVPTGDQLELFREFIPGWPFKLREHYQQKMKVATLAAAGATTCTELGDEEGPYIGRTMLGGTPVYFDPHRAPRMNASTLIGIAGRPGSGKTNLGFLMMYQARLRETSTVYADPKAEGDGLAWLCQRKLGSATVNRVRFDDSRSEGLLDPYRMMPGGSAATLAATILQTMLPSPQPGSVKNAIISATTRAVDLPRPTLAGAIETLLSYADTGEVAAAADTLHAMSRWDLSRACFNPMGGEHLELRNKLTLLQFVGLPLPEAGMDPEHYTDENRVATALMHSMAALGGQVMFTGSKSEQKMIVYDDALPILQSAEGRALLARDTLKGRAWNCVPVVISQNATHLADETLASNLGAAFVFRLPDVREAEAGLRLLDRTASEENLWTVQHLGPDPIGGELPGWSECVMRDLGGRAGRLQPDLMTDEIRRAFSTTPGNQFAAAEPVPSADGRQRASEVRP